MGTGDWRAAAQFGVLLGRLRLEAGLAQPDPRGRPGWLRRRAMALRCRRCGSEAKSRTACAACGSAACAYCEACLAMGRSRACALLLHGTAGSAVRGTAGVPPRPWAGGGLAQRRAPPLALRCSFGGAARRLRGGCRPVSHLGGDRCRKDRNDLSAAAVHSGCRRARLGRSAKTGRGAGAGTSVIQGFSRGNSGHVIWRKSGPLEAGKHHAGNDASAAAIQGAFDLVVIDEIDAFPIITIRCWITRPRVLANQGNISICQLPRQRLYSGRQLRVDCHMRKFQHASMGIRYPFLRN